MSTTTHSGHFLTLYKMALADDHVDPSEMEMLYSIALGYGISKEALVEILMNPQSIEDPFPETVQEKLLLLFNIARMACADGNVTSEERICMTSSCIKFGFEEANVEEIADFVIEQAKLGVSNEDFLKVVNEYI